MEFLIFLAGPRRGEPPGELEMTFQRTQLTCFSRYRIDPPRGLSLCGPISFAANPEYEQEKRVYCVKFLRLLATTRGAPSAVVAKMFWRCTKNFSLWSSNFLPEEMTFSETACESTYELWNRIFWLYCI